MTTASGPRRKLGVPLGGLGVSVGGLSDRSRHPPGKCYRIGCDITVGFWLLSSSVYT